MEDVARIAVLKIFILAPVKHEAAVAGPGQGRGKELHDRHIHGPGYIDHLIYIAYLSQGREEVDAEDKKKVMLLQKGVHRLYGLAGGHVLAADLGGLFDYGEAHFPEAGEDVRFTDGIVSVEKDLHVCYHSTKRRRQQNFFRGPKVFSKTADTIVRKLKKWRWIAI